jgi:hypothetical protein
MDGQSRAVVLAAAVGVEVPAVVGPRDDVVDLVIARRSRLGLVAGAVRGIEAEAERIAHAERVRAVAERIAGRRLAHGRDPQDLAVGITRVLGVRRISLIADRHVEHPVGPEREAAAVVVVEVRREPVEDHGIATADAALVLEPDHAIHER